MDGDEVGGIVIIHELIKRVRKQLVCGALCAFPLMNPLGFETASRDIILSKEDLNRSFPGIAEGSIAERIADTTFTTISRGTPTLVLDLHNDWRKSIPYTAIDPRPGQVHETVYRRAEEFGTHTGLLFIRDADILKKALTYSLLQHNIPALTLELGESYVVNERRISSTVSVRSGTS